MMILMAAILMPASVQAKKIKYGTMVLYDGKVKNDVPTGEGTLTTTCGTFIDVLVGNFVGDGTVTDAQLKFPSGWKYQGSLSYEVEIDGSKVTYKLTEGELYVISASVYKSNVKDFTLKIVPKSPVTLVRTPQVSNIDLKKFVYDTTIPGALVYDDFPAPLSLKDFGDKNTATSFANCTILPTSKVNATSGSGTDPLRNLQEKDFAGVTEPWTFLTRPEDVTMADGTNIMVFDEDKGKYCSVTYPDGEEIAWSYSNTNKNGTVSRLIKKFSDNSTLYINIEKGGKDSPWNITYPDKSKAKGDIRFNGKNLQINHTQSLDSYSVQDVFKYVMQESSFENLGAKLYNGTLTMVDGTIVNYRRGFDEAVLSAQEEARQKALEEGIPLVLAPSDVVGQWILSDPYQMSNSYCYYLLELTHDNMAMITLTTNYYGVDKRYNKPYYACKTFNAGGSYQLSENRIIFKWDKSQKKNTSLKRKYNTEGTIPPIVQTNVDDKEKQFSQMLSTVLNTATISLVSDRQLTISDSKVPVVFTRDGDEDEQLVALKKEQKSKEYFHFNETTGEIKAFKHYFNDGVVTLDKDNQEEKWFIIEYNNGDKFEGGGNVGVFAGDGKFVGSNEKPSNYKEFCNAILEIPNLSDLDLLYWYGTFTKANGTILKFEKGMTNRQINQFAKNLGTISDIIDQEVAAYCKQLKDKSMAAKKQLLAEGFAPAYVNSMFDQFRILNGTPKALIDRAIQLGCHITRHPVVMEDAHFNWKKSGETYAIVITNYNTGNDVFEGFVKFHWLNHRVMYVGKQIQ